MRAAQLEFNMKLIEAAEGLLAPLSGDERVLSCACSHFTAGCRAAKHGCRTVEEQLKDPTGHINVLQLTQNDEDMKGVIEEGFDFTIIPWYAEVIFPELPTLAQAALNAEHTTYSMASELQVAAGIASHAEMAGGSPNWDTVHKRMKAAMPPCKDYIQVLVDFVKHFSDGVGAPIVKFLDAWAKTYGSNNKLGEVFLEAVVYAQFPSSDSKFPLVRVALLAANLVCHKSKVVEGIARLLTKTDVAMLCRKDKTGAVIAAEEVLADAWARIKTQLNNKSLDEKTAYGLFGKLASRTALFLCKKGKEGLEAREFKTLKEIKVLCDQEFSNSSSPAAHTAAEAAETNVPEKMHEAQASLEDMANPQYLAESKGFKVGQLFTEKDTKSVFKLESFDARGAKFSEQTLHGTSLAMTVQYKDFDKSFTAFKGKLQVKLPSAVSQHFAYAHPVLKSELAKTYCFQALVEAGESYSQAEEATVSFFLGPAEVRCKEGCKAKELKLIPSTLYSGIVVKSKESKFVMSHKEYGQFYLEAPPKPKDEKKEDWKKEHTLAGFWWVKSTDDKAAANMTLVKVAFNGFTIPAYENHKVLKEQDKLLVYVEPSPTKKART